MALVSNGFELVVTLIDRGSNTTTRVFDFTSGVDTYAEAVTETGNVLTALAAVTDCVVAGYSIKEKFEENALTLPAGATAEVSAHAEVSGRLAGYTTKRATVDIPGPKDAIFVSPTVGANYNVVNTANAAVLAYVGLFGTAGNVAYISDGEQLDSANLDLKGKRTHSKSRNG